MSGVRDDGDLDGRFLGKGYVLAVGCQEFAVSSVADIPPSANVVLIA